MKSCKVCVGKGNLGNSGRSDGSKSGNASAVSVHPAQNTNSNTASLAPKSIAAGGSGSVVSPSALPYPKVWSLGNVEECAVYLFYRIGNGRKGFLWDSLSQNSRRRWRNKVRSSLPDSRVVA